MNNALYKSVARFKSVQRLASVVAECRCRLFDWHHHIETCGTAEVSRLTTRSENVLDGLRYEPTHPRLVFEILDSLRIDHSRFTYIDIGSGKGRTLVIASEYPFRRVVGIEFAEELHQVALKNVASYRSGTQRCQNIDCLLMDATEFIPPSVPTVFWMFNPFRGSVMERVLHNLEESLMESPRDVLLIYVAPFHAQLIEGETRLRISARGRYHTLYQYSPEQAASQAGARQ